MTPHHLSLYGLLFASLLCVRPAAVIAAESAAGESVTSTPTPVHQQTPTAGTEQQAAPVAPSPGPAVASSQPHAVIDDTISRLQLSLEELQLLKQGILAQDAEPPQLSPAAAPAPAATQPPAPPIVQPLTSASPPVIEAPEDGGLADEQYVGTAPVVPAASTQETPSSILNHHFERAETRAPASSERVTSAANSAVTGPPPTPLVEDRPSPLPPAEMATADADLASDTPPAEVPSEGGGSGGGSTDNVEAAGKIVSGGYQPSEPEPPSPTAAPAEPPVVIARDIRTLPVQADSISNVVPSPAPSAEPEPEPTAAAAAAGENGTESAAREQLLVPETGSGEDIQPFNEWASKRVEETQKKTDNTASPSSASGAPVKKPPVRHRIKNYASPDCGAKVLAANPGATSAGNVLSPGRDEYMLNSCETRVWLVVELCEGIQASRLELSNDELYSSSPREFAVFLTDRYPTREWNKVGQFTAQELRGPQTFHLPTVVFGKFVKVEILSHYGAHYYCTVSTLRVFGASEYEVLDTQDSEGPADETSDYEEMLEPAEPTDRPNLLNRALQAVNNMVQTAKVAFAAKPGGEDSSHCISIDERHVPTVLSAEERAQLGCGYRWTVAVADSQLLTAAQRSCRLCAPSDGQHSLHSPLCGLVRQLLSSRQLRDVCLMRQMSSPPPEVPPQSVPDSDNSTAQPPPPDRPPAPPAEPETAAGADDGTAAAATPLVPSTDATTGVSENSSAAVAASSIGNDTVPPPPAVQTPQEGGAADAIPAEQMALPSAAVEPELVPTEQPPAQKESVFVRLSNRIKALELNMSLSQQYLDELSRRYKRQVEEMQRTFNKTIAALEGTARDAEARDALQQESISALQSQLLNLTSAVRTLAAERDQFSGALLHRHLLLLAAEAVALALAAWLCLGRQRRHTQPAPAVTARAVRAARPRHNQPPARRNASTSSVRRVPAAQAADREHRRRPSDEVVNIAGTYRELLISECEPMARRRRRPAAIVRSQSTWSASSDEGAPGEVAVPGVGLLFSRSPPVGYVDRRHAGYGSGAAAAAANPYSPLRQLQNGGDAQSPPLPPPPPPPPPPPQPGGKIVNGRACQAALEWKRKESMKSRSGRAKEERRRSRKKLVAA